MSHLVVRRLLIDLATPFERHCCDGIFAVDLCRQTLANLRRDGGLYRFSTWRSAASLLFGRHGLVSTTLRPWARYLRRSFHPSQHSDTAARRWLLEHADSYAVVGGHG